MLGSIVENDILIKLSEYKTITFDGLLNEVRAVCSQKHCFDKAVESILRKYDVACAHTQEVLRCELRADIRKERLPSTIVFSDHNATEYVRVLLHYGVLFRKAMERLLAQFKIRRYSKESRRLFRHISSILNRRSLATQRKNAAFNRALV